MAVQNKYSDLDREFAISLYKSGRGYLWISSIIGCAHSTVRKWISKAKEEGEPGLTIRPGPSRDPRIRSAAIDMYKSRIDLSLMKVAEVMGVSQNSLRRWLRAEGVKLRGIRPSVYDNESIEKDIRSGMCVLDISLKHKCSEGWVYKIKRGMF